MSKLTKNMVVGLFVLSLIGGLSYYKISQPEVVHANGSLAKHYTDEEAAKVAKYIVIGQVKQKLKSYDRNGLPVTDLQVEVIKNLKGNIGQEFIFTQDGGYLKETNQIVIFDNYEILTLGEQYLFFLDKVDEEGRYWSIGGPLTVYRLEGTQAMNSFPSRNKAVKQLEDVISKEVNKQF